MTPSRGRHDAGGSDRDSWERRHAESVGSDRPPSEWVVARCLELPASLVVADIACGLGRHAGRLAEYGRTVFATDWVEHAVRTACRTAGVFGVVADATALPFAPESLEVILCVNYLDRSAFEVF